MLTDLPCSRGVPLPYIRYIPTACLCSGFWSAKMAGILNTDFLSVSVLSARHLIFQMKA